MKIHQSMWIQCPFLYTKWFLNQRSLTTLDDLWPHSLFRSHVWLYPRENCHTTGSPLALLNWTKLKICGPHRYRGEIPKLAAIFSRHGEQFGGIRFYSESACVNCIFLRYEHVFNRARKAATSATHIKVIARVICIAHSPHLFSAKSRIPPNCSPCREKNLRGRYWNFGISVSRICVCLFSENFFENLRQKIIKT